MFLINFNKNLKELFLIIKKLLANSVLYSELLRTGGEKII